MILRRIGSPQLLGALALVASFAAGWVASIAWHRKEGTAVTVDVRMSTRLPPELTALGLSPAQADTLRRILRDGNQEVRRILQEFDPRIRAATVSVETQIRAVLTPGQRERFDASRTRQDQRQVQIDTVAR